MSRLLRSKKGNDMIWVTMDRLMKSTLFLPMNIYMCVCVCTRVDKLTIMYMNQVVRLYGVPELIVSDRDP